MGQRGVEIRERRRQPPQVTKRLAAGHAHSRAIELAQIVSGESALADGDVEAPCGGAGDACLDVPIGPPLGRCGWRDREQKGG